MMETRCFLILFAAFLLLTIRNLKEEFKMSDLRNVSLELQRMQREMKKKEAEYHRRKAESCENISTH